MKERGLLWKQDRCATNVIFFYVSVTPQQVLRQVLVRGRVPQVAP